MNRDTEEDSTPYMEKNSIHVEITNVLNDMLSLELERPVQDAPNDVLSQKLERVVEDARIDMIPQEIETPVQIFVIPSYVKERNPEAYEPKMVSIGPYHFRKPQLKPMESHKKRAVIQFLKRSPRNAIREQLINALMKVHDRLWKSYEQVSELSGYWTPDNFIKLMMVDGIFLLEFLDVAHGNRNGNDYADTDPIFGKRGHILNYNYVMEDLLLLENQVPHLVLSTLLTVSESQSVEETDNYLSRLMLAPTATKGHHLLDMYTKGTLGKKERQKPVTGEGAVKVSAAKLRKTFGLKFKPVETYKDLKFSRRTKTLKLPTIILDKGTICRFHNLKAYQVLAGDTSKELISYIHLLNFFILSANDVNLLRSQGIIVSCLDSDKDVITVMNELMRDIMAENIDDKSAGTIEKVRKHCERKGFVHHCFVWIITRWRWVLAVSGAMLFVIDSIQSIYSITYYRRN